jgi:hypothetical protein
MSPRPARTSTPAPKPAARQPSDSTAAIEPELVGEELEERITPRLASNHNETLLTDV